MLDSPDPDDDRDADRPLDRRGEAGSTLARIPERRRPIVAAVAIAVAWTLAIVGFVVVTRPGGAEPGIAVGRVAPGIEGTGLDGRPVSLAALRGHPVIVHFWGPSCVPCRAEFPLFKAKLAEHAGDGLTILGVLMGDPPEPALDFIAELGATWPTIDDPDGRLRRAYRVVARPQSYFIDGDGIVRAIQVGQTTSADFERLYAKIAP